MDVYSFWDGKFNLYDFVTVICDKPYGIEDSSYFPNVKGNVGMVIRICDYTTFDGTPCYEVKDTEGNEIVYAGNEIVPANEYDVNKALKELIERR